MSPDEKGVEEVKVFIVLNPEYEEKITEENIIEWAKKRNGCIQNIKDY